MRTGESASEALQSLRNTIKKGDRKFPPGSEEINSVIRFVIIPCIPGTQGWISIKFAYHLDLTVEVL